MALTFGEERHSAAEVQEANLETFRRLEAVPITEIGERERIYREEIQGSTEIKALRHAFDRWCAAWFWPVGDEKATLLLPSNFTSDDPAISQSVERLRERHQFFHWELEFPDVFVRESPGFDATLGNPPWDIQKPNSKEFFSNHDPIYRTYGKQEALRHQSRLFEQEPRILADWLRYVADFKAMGNWVASVADPYALNLVKGKDGERLTREWEAVREARKGYLRGGHPFRHQGSADINTYKLFLESAYRLIHVGGRLGFIIPSGIYTDKGTTDLRRLFLEKSDWKWLFGFENRAGIFPIHRSYKFCPIIVEKSGSTDATRASFMHRDLASWESPDPPHIWLPKDTISRFSPTTLSFMEFRSKRDVEICEKIYGDHPIFGDKVEGGWNVEFGTEFHMTNDSKLFRPRPDWEREGYRPDEYGRWIGPEGDVALPLYEGRMIGQFDFSEKGWVSGKGRTAKWRAIPFDQKVLEPQYLMAQTTYLESDKAVRGYKVGFMDVTSSTNARTMIAATICNLPCGNSAPVLKVGGGRLDECLPLTSILNSFAYDFVTRRRCGGLHLNWFVIDETPIPKMADGLSRDFLVHHAARLSFTHPMFAPEWLRLRQTIQGLGGTPWTAHWAITASERLRTRCMIEGVVAEIYGLSLEDMQLILTIDESDPIGFWRVDQDLRGEQRLTSLTLKAFEHLKQVGLEEFCRQGWDLPDYARALDRPGVKSWTPTEDWSDCERHARYILGDDSFTHFMAGLSGEASEQAARPADHVSEPPPSYGTGTPGAQRPLFPGDPTLFGDATEDPPTRRKRKG